MAILKLQESPKLSAKPTASETKFAEQQSKKENQIEVFDCNDGSIDEEEEEKLRFVLETVQKLRSRELGGKDFTHSPKSLIHFYSNIPSLFEMRRRVTTQVREDISHIDASHLVEKLVVVENDHEAMKAAFVAALERSEVLNNAANSMGDCRDQFVCAVRKFSEDVDSTVTICMAELHNQKSKVTIMYDEIVFELDNETALGMYPKLAASFENC